MAITTTQVQRIRDAHAAGKLDPAIAQAASVSIATVKRYRDRLGLETNSEATRRGKLGERLVAQEAIGRGFEIEWREHENDVYDLYINDQRVDAKASMQLTDGSWRFRLSHWRSSFFGQYRYYKDYAADCEVVALVALYLDGREPDFYLLDSKTLPGDIRIRPGGIFHDFKNDWTRLEDES